MPITSDESIIGIRKIGTWTSTSVTGGAPGANRYNADNVYTKTPLGRPASDGAKITPSINKVKQRAGDSGGVVDSAISEYDLRLEFKLLGAVLNNLRIMLGLPSTALTGDLSAGTPTAEHLVVKGTELGTQSFRFYIECNGPAGPRTFYFPLCSIESLMEININKGAHMEPGAGWEILEDADGNAWWTIDAAA
jgi:hypothetical protein